jgi:hypothetical protein
MWILIHVTLNKYSSSVALQPGVGLGLLYNTPPSPSIPCSFPPFVYSHLLNIYYSGDKGKEIKKDEMEQVILNKIVVRNPEGKVIIRKTG